MAVKQLTFLLHILKISGLNLGEELSDGGLTWISQAFQANAEAVAQIRMGTNSM
jgi:hypothetical protein